MPVVVAAKTASVGGTKRTTQFFTSSTTYVSTGISISVPNNEYYAIAFSGNTNVNNNDFYRVLEGAVEKKVWQAFGTAGDAKAYSSRNTQGSAQTVELQARNAVSAETTYVDISSGIVRSPLLATAGLLGLNKEINFQVPIRGTVDTLRLRSAGARKGGAIAAMELEILCFGLSIPWYDNVEHSLAPAMVSSSIPIFVAERAGSNAPKAWALAIDFDGFTIRVTT